MKTIARYSFPHEAHIAKASLDAAEIFCAVADEHTVNMNWLNSNAMGGVRLMVKEEDEEQALEILASDFSDSIPEKEEVETPVCLKCGSNQLRESIKGGWSGVLATLLFMLPIPSFKSGMQCQQCNHFQSHKKH